MMWFAPAIHLFTLPAETLPLGLRSPRRGSMYQFGTVLLTLPVVRSTVKV